MSNVQIVGLVYLGLMFLYLRYICRLIARRTRLRTRGVRIRGRVMKVDRHISEDGPDVFTPTVRYYPQKARGYDIKLSSVTDSNKYRAGASVDLLYDPDNPAIAQAVSDTGWVITAHQVVCGFLIAFGVYVYLSCLSAMERPGEAAAGQVSK